MVWPPTARLEVLKLAVVVPPLVLSVPWPMLLPLSRKTTVPVGLADVALPGPFTVTVAVNVTLWPLGDEVALATTAVLVLASSTVWLGGLDVLVLRFVSPPLVV